MGGGGRGERERDRDRQRQRQRETDTDTQKDTDTDRQRYGDRDQETDLERHTQGDRQRQKEKNLSLYYPQPSRSAQIIHFLPSSWQITGRQNNVPDRSISTIVTNEICHPASLSEYFTIDFGVEIICTEAGLAPGLRYSPRHACAAVAAPRERLSTQILPNSLYPMMEMGRSGRRNLFKSAANFGEHLLDLQNAEGGREVATMDNAQR